MTIIQEIRKWSASQPCWQQDVIARLYAKRKMSSEDIDDVYALLKSEHGIIDPKGRKPGQLMEDQVAAPQVAGRNVQLAAVKNFQNVNAIAAGQRIPLAPTGLTVIYGDNGAGKSGYSRVLKRACRARDQREPILPDANADPKTVGPAQAVFEIIVDGKSVEVAWTEGQTPPSELSAISIFDSHCARAYVDNHGDFAYAPYGLDLLEGLVDQCGKLKLLAAKEKAQTKPNLEPFSALTNTPTKVGALLSRISGSTDIAMVETMATLNKIELARLATLTETLAEADPKQKAQVLRLRATRFGSTATRIEGAVEAIDDTKVESLQVLVEESNTAKRTAAIAAADFKDAEGLLTGTGGEIWKALFESAREFATVSYPDQTFPHLVPESLCPLCQNPLNDSGLSRLESFETFVQQEAEKTAKAARRAAGEAYKAIEQAQLNLVVDKALETELNEFSPELGDSCVALQKALMERQKSICDAAASKLKWEDIPALPSDQRELLESSKDQLNVSASALEDSLGEKARLEMISEHTELDARRRLSEIKATVIDAIAKTSLCEKLQACVDATGTTRISRKSTELAKTMATPEVVKALNTELKALNVHELCVTMKNMSPRGKTSFKLILELPGGVTPAQILSEGEKRAIAIASFLAEINLGTGIGGIVFDDPVSSLDHRCRWHVARRFAQEASRRQVIVFTHDIYFLFILQQEADAAGVGLLAQCVRKSPEGFGAQTDRLPFDVMPTGKRVSALRVMCTDAARAHKAGDEDEARRLTHNAYHNLRLAWERAVEEVLFQGVVKRFDEGITTKMLRGVVVENSDYSTIKTGMTKSSKFEHDPAAAAHLPTPHPDELSADIEKLESWRSHVVSRVRDVTAERA